MKNQKSRLFTLALALAGGLASAQDAQPVSSVTGQRPQGESRIEVGANFAQVFGSSSFSGTRTALTPQAFIAETDAWSAGLAPLGTVGCARLRQLT